MWKNILGHKKQTDQLNKSLTEKRLPHALLFSGIEGIGKQTIALRLAETLVGETKKFHPDIHLIEPVGTTIKVDTIRELKRKIYLHPLEGKAKVVLINKPEAMTEATANALLKILEEPPQDTYFILISAQAGRLLPTIRSRCQTIDFSPLNESDIEKYLEQQGISKEEAHQRALVSEGSLKAALELNPELFEETKNRLETLLKNPKPSLIFDLSEEWSHDDEKIPLILTMLHHLWHRKIIAKDSAVTTEIRFKQWQSIQDASRQLEFHANKQLLFENLLFTLAAQ
ncbi:MAG: DNA polymerase III subunit delta' [Deltaproteobacteria bacterium]|nr:DNA polymerase III subunit delta' [Deltaproteobacteria bacterium]